MSRSADREALLSTRQLCEDLGVSRSWVNTHLSHLGGEKVAGGRTRSERRAVMYDPAKVLAWLNENAIFSRQTVPVHVGQFFSEEDLASCTADGDFEKMLAKRLPEEWPELLANAEWRAREMRGYAPWVCVSHKIKRLAQLHTMKQLLAERGSHSSELIYRYMYESGWIRAEVAGRCWWMEPPEQHGDRLRFPFAVPTMEAVVFGCCMTQPISDLKEEGNA